jgi:hypothetical protein
MDINTRAILLQDFFPHHVFGTFLILKLLPVWTCHKEEGKIHRSLEPEQRAYVHCSTMAASP